MANKRNKDGPEVLGIPSSDIKLFSGKLTVGEESGKLSLTGKHPRVDCICLAEWSRANKKTRAAIKKVSGFSKGDIDIYRNEIDMCKLIKQLKHRNVVRILDVIEAPAIFNRGYIVMDYHSNSLYDEITVRVKDFQSRKYKQIPQSQAFHYLSGILEGMYFLNTHGIAHGDIKPQHILVHNTTQQSKRAILCDFGQSTYNGGSSNTIICKGLARGTPLYMAPEVIYESDYDAPKADVFSAGVTLYNMVYAEDLYRQEDPSYQRDSQKISGVCSLKDKFLHHLFYLTKLKQDTNYLQSMLQSAGKPNASDELLIKMLTPDPNQRITTEEAFYFVQQRSKQ